MRRRTKGPRAISGLETHRPTTTVVRGSQRRFRAGRQLNGTTFRSAFQTMSFELSILTGHRSCRADWQVVMAERHDVPTGHEGKGDHIGYCVVSHCQKLVD